jgi:hypothetical protein
MEHLSHDKIDFLKLNIEGSEVVSLIHMLENTNIRPTYISAKMELSRDKPCENTFVLQNKLNSLLKEDYNVIFNCKENYTFELR